MNTIKRYIKENKNLYIFLKKIQLESKKIVISFIQLIIYCFPINNKKIVVSSYYGQGYGDNAKCVIDELLKINKNCEIIWLVKNKKINVPSYIKKIRYGSLKALFHLSTAKIWLDNCRKENIYLKRKKQYYIQLWHGSLPLKMIEKDAENTLSYDYIFRAKIDSKMTDLMISGSEFATKIYYNAFWYNGEILEKGTPKDDLLFDNEKHQEIINKTRQMLNLPQDKKIVLYAPTFRENHRIDCYNIDYKCLKEILEEKYQKEYIILIRLHPNLINENKKLRLPSDVIDVTNYPNLNELMIISDILITDYSSIMFSYSFMKKKVFLYCTDIEEYNNTERKFYFDINKLPFLLIKSNNELKKKIMSFDEKKYLKELDSFLNDINIKESGKASKEIANIINKKMINN